MASERKLVIVLIGIGSILLFSNLGIRQLTMDECYQGLLAESILKNGYPNCWNGENLFTVSNGIDFNQSGVMIYFSWFPQYLTALFYMVFGKSELVARMPFAIMGFISMVYFYLIMKKLTSNKFMINTGLILYIFSVPMLLYFRSATYYGAAVTFINMSLYYYLSIIETNKNAKAFLLFGMSLIFLFHTNYGLSLTPLLVYLIYILWTVREKNIIYRLFGTYLFIAAFTAPWYIYKIITTRGTEKGLFLGLTGTVSVISRLFEYIWKIQTYFFPFMTLFAMLCIFLFISKYFIPLAKSESTTWDRRLIIPILFIVINLVTVVVLDPIVHTRRLIPSMTMFYILMPLILWQMVKYSKHLGYLLVCVLIFTNWLQILPWRILDWSNIPVHRSILFQSPVTLPSLFHDNTWSFAKYGSGSRYLLYEYYKELTEQPKDYKTRIGGVIDYLNTHAKPGETVLATNIETLSLIYYTKLKVVNQLNPERSVWGPFGQLIYTSYPSAQKYRERDYLPDDKVDWIIYQSRIPFPFEDPDYFSSNRSKYEKIYIDAPDQLVEGLAEINYHIFSSPKTYRGFHIYRRKASI